MTKRNRTTLAVALLLPVTTWLWLLAVPGAVGSSTYAMFAAIVIAMAVIGLTTWKNSQATGSMGQLLHETDLSPHAVPIVTESTNASRWQSWQIRGDALAETGRVRALLGLSVALTGALLYWMA